MYTNEVTCVPNMVPNECKSGEPRIQEILDKTEAVVADVRAASLYIRNTLFANGDMPPVAPKRDINCARDAMMDICATLNEVLDILNYVGSRL